MLKILVTIIVLLRTKLLAQPIKMYQHGYVAINFIPVAACCCNPGSSEKEVADNSNSAPTCQLWIFCL